MTIRQLVIMQCKNDPAFCILNESPNHLSKMNNSTGMSAYYLVGVGYMGLPASDIPMYQVFVNRI